MRTLLEAYEDLLRLPEVMRAVAAGERILVVEGEKDVDRLAGLGLTANDESGRCRQVARGVQRGAAVRHLNKCHGGRSIYAGQGSIDFTAAARSVLLAGCGGDDGAGGSPCGA